MTKFLFSYEGLRVYYHADDGTYSLKSRFAGGVDVVRGCLSDLPFEIQHDAQVAASSLKRKTKSNYLLG